MFADFDANQRLVLQGRRVRLSETVVASHSTQGVSHQRRNGAEMFRIVAANYGMAYLPLSWLDCKWHGLLRRLARYVPR